MRKTLMLSLGVAVTLVAAVFVGAAAATTGAPVFYDARYPAPATTGPGGYDVSEGDGGEPGSPGAVDETDADGAPLPTPPGARPDPTSPPTVEPSPPATAPPTGAPTPTPDPEPTPTPDPEPTPTPDPESAPTPDTEDPAADRLAPDAQPSAEEQQAWLAFQQIVRECMAEGGHEYLSWEWWNPAPNASNRSPAMPADLTADEAAAWELALHGDSTGDVYRWEDAGCWGYAVHVTGGTN